MAGGGCLLMAFLAMVVSSVLLWTSVRFALKQGTELGQYNLDPPPPTPRVVGIYSGGKGIVVRVRPLDDDEFVPT